MSKRRGERRNKGRREKTSMGKKSNLSRKLKRTRREGEKMKLKAKI